MPFEDSRRLTGSNLFFASTGAVLETAGIPIDDALISGWAARVAHAAAYLAWADRQAVARRHANGVSLALAAPCDQLFLATEVNEWALCAAVVEHKPGRRRKLEQALIARALDAADGAADVAADLMPVIEQAAAFARFERLAALEKRPLLRALLAAAAVRGLPHLVDDAELTLGSGTGGHTFPLTALPALEAVRWDELRDIPTAIVTGSNGKTTTVRLLAACARAHGWRTAYNCTDGVFLDHETLATGDYSGPAGARLVLRERRAQAAVLETARGGILRRGIAASRAAVAIVTNVSSDHFGEYGIDDLDALTDVKLTVAAVVAPGGTLVLNADDSRLSARAESLARRFGRRPQFGWFALDADHPTLRGNRTLGASTCGARAGRLHLSHGGAEHDVGPVAEMPLSIGGLAGYNVANMAGAALVAAVLGIAPAAIASVLARFGADRQDNPGRLMRYDLDGVQILIDYAHNPDGLRGFLMVADRLRSATGRLGLLLGHAGNRKDADIAELARAAAEFRPDIVIVKEDEAHLRGRAPGEIPRILRAELLRLGIADSALPVRGSEIEAARCAIDWARPGDVLALPVHSPAARAALEALLQSGRVKTG